MAHVTLDFIDTGSRSVKLETTIHEDSEITPSVAMVAAVRALFDSGLLGQMAMQTIEAIGDGGSGADRMLELYGGPDEADAG